MEKLLQIADWFLRFIKMDRSSRSTRKSFRDYDNRMRYPVLTRKILESLDDSDLVDAVRDYVQLKIEADYQHKFQIVSSLPRSFQAVYSTWWVDAEVNNGGFHQYFFNQGADWAFMALEGYKLMGAREMAGLMARAIEVHLREEPEQQECRANGPLHLLEQYVEARKISGLPELDRTYYSLSFYDVAIGYIRSHLDDFVGK
jgi:hypothetical protein